MKPINYYVGIVIILLGALFLFGNLFDSGVFWGIFWPIFVLIPGLLFLWLWQSLGNGKKSWGLLIPATVLITYAVVFFLNAIVTKFFHYPTIWGWTTFAYVGALALAFWFSWVVTGIDGLHFVSKILTIFSIVIFLVVGFSITFFSILPTDLSAKLWPLIFILIGLLIIGWQLIWRSFWKGNKFLGKTEEEWREWGENLGKEIGEEIKDHSKKNK